MPNSAFTTAYSAFFRNNSAEISPDSAFFKVLSHLLHKLPKYSGNSPLPRNTKPAQKEVIKKRKG